VFATLLNYERLLKITFQELFAAVVWVARPPKTASSTAATFQPQGTLSQIIRAFIPNLKLWYTTILIHQETDT
jgi:hypothetical protein